MPWRTFLPFCCLAQPQTFMMQSTSGTSLTSFSTGSSRPHHSYNLNHLMVPAQESAKSGTLAFDAITDLSDLDLDALAVHKAEAHQIRQVAWRKSSTAVVLATAVSRGDSSQSLRLSTASAVKLRHQQGGRTAAMDFKRASLPSKSAGTVVHHRNKPVSEGSQAPSPGSRSSNVSGAIVPPGRLSRSWCYNATAFHP